MNFENISFIKAMSYMSLYYENICTPIQRVVEYDFICERKKRFYKIKVIYSKNKKGDGNYEVNLRSSGGYNKTNSVKKDFDNTSCFWLFVSTPELCYLIPASKINNKRSLNTKLFKKYEIRGNSSVG